jgi:aspartyl-tRNA(Asn)/glutamyl-tRNA(Gln) amidotransferase subunit C
MSISRDEVVRLARLAHLDLDESAIESMTRDLGAVLAYAERLPALPEDGGPDAGEGPLREDRVVSGLEPGEATASAPEREGNLFRVPPVLGGE